MHKAQAQHFLIVGRQAFHGLAQFRLRFAAEGNLFGDQFLILQQCGFHLLDGDGRASAHAPVVIGHLALGNPLQPEQPVRFWDGGKLIVFQRCQEDLQQQVFGVLPGMRVSTHIGKDHAPVLLV